MPTCQLSWREVLRFTSTLTSAFEWIQRRTNRVRAFIACFTWWNTVFRVFFFLLRMGVKLLTLPSPPPPRSIAEHRICERKRNDAQTHIRIPYQFIFLSTNPSCSTDFSLASSSVGYCRVVSLYFYRALFFVRSWVLFYLLLLSLAIHFTGIFQLKMCRFAKRTLLCSAHSVYLLLRLC